MAHTPGPWRHIDQGAGGETVYRDGGAKTVARQVTSEDDARLIAAAPDLLAACEAIADLEEDFCECDNTHAAVGTVCRPCFAVARAQDAIAKVRGK